MTFDCLVGFIGLSSNVSGEVQSGLYADALPDISEAHVTKLVDGEDTVAKLWAEIEKRAILKFRTFFIRAINEAHKISDRDRYSCLENPMDREAWQATVYRVTKSRTQLND